MSQPVVIGDPEKGTMDLVLPAELPPIHAKDLHNSSYMSEKSNVTSSAVTPTLPLKHQDDRKPKPQPKKRAGWRIRALLWFNTYRSVIPLHSMLNFQVHYLIGNSLPSS